MSINALQGGYPIKLLKEDAGKAKTPEVWGSSFHSLLSRMSGEKAHPPGSERAAAEILRLEMMQSSLALGGGEEQQTPRASVFPDLLSTLAGSGYGLRPGARHGASPDQGPPPPPEAGPQSDGIEATASRFLGTPYLFGGEGASGIDCSSFVQQVYQEHRIDLPRTAREQMNVGSEVAPSELKKGDLVFFRTYASYPSHVGIYLGEGKMIHASSVKGEVTVSDMSSNYYRSRYLGAKRVG